MCCVFLTSIGQCVSGDTTSQPQITVRRVFLGTAHKQRCQDQNRRGQQFDHHVQGWTSGVLERIAHRVSRYGGLGKESTEEACRRMCGNKYKNENKNNKESEYQWCHIKQPQQKQRSNNQQMPYLVGGTSFATMVTQFHVFLRVVPGTTNVVQEQGHQNPRRRCKHQVPRQHFCPQQSISGVIT